ncbi:hypothetical protein EB001_15300 [bacterium]|nr:hypothetical protein [bacterium]
MEELVAILTINQKDSLIGQLVCPDVYFNPTLDVNENWFISQQEINNSIYSEHDWVKDLTLSVYAGPYVPPQPQPVPSGTTIS